ncbi:MAG: chromosomal replication initiator protein DnaA [Magnetovibrio sp.]|nr:chromosomal replication initiator protein DnaA [Magnetovibrio sp.]
MTAVTVDTQVVEQWNDVLTSLREEIGEAAFQSWLKPMMVREVLGTSVRISVPTRFMKDWVVAHYVDRLSELWEGISSDIRKVEIFVQADYGQPKSISPTTASAQGSLQGEPQHINLSNAAPANTFKPMTGSPTRPHFAAPHLAVPQISAHGALDISGPLDTRLTFENFVVGKSNEFAHAASLRVAQQPNAQFNPLFLYGGVGLGKTHLMNAIAWKIRQEDPSRTVIYMSAEKFMYRFIRALREQNTVDFKDQFRNVDVLMIDDVQFISGKNSTQEEFFHTFNALVDQGRQIVISADKSPSDLEGIEERLKSRLNCGLVADIHATTYELRLGILQAKAERMNVEVPGKVMEFLAHKITSNVRELEGALNRVAAHSSLVGRDITLESVQDVLHDLIRAHDRRVTIEEIQKKVAAHFNIRTSDMHSARRARSVARPRQVAMYLAKQLTSRSLPEIGRKFGGRDHTTVMHAVKKVDELREHDPSFAEDVELLRRMLEG